VKRFSHLTGYFHDRRTLINVEGREKMWDEGTTAEEDGLKMKQQQPWKKKRQKDRHFIRFDARKVKKWGRGYRQLWFPHYLYNWIGESDNMRKEKYYDSHDMTILPFNENLCHRSPLLFLHVLFTEGRLDCVPSGWPFPLVFRELLQEKRLLFVSIDFLGFIGVSVSLCFTWQRGSKNALRRIRSRCGDDDIHWYPITDKLPHAVIRDIPSVHFLFHSFKRSSFGFGIDDDSLERRL
jgi:hypothetical protein